MTNWFIGCPGETIHQVDWEKMPPIRIAINYAARYVPDYTYWAAVDKLPLAEYGYIAGKPRIMYRSGYENSNPSYFWADEVALVDYRPIGTLDLSVQFAVEQGASHIIIGGTDTKGTTIDESTRPRYEANPTERELWCARVRERCIQIMEASQVDYTYL